MSYGFVCRNAPEVPTLETKVSVADAGQHRGRPVGRSMRMGGALRRLRDGVSLIGLATTSLFAAQAATAQTAPPLNVVGACSGVSLPKSVVTGILSPVVTGIAQPLQNTIDPLIGNLGSITAALTTPILGVSLVTNLPIQATPPLSIDVAGILAQAANNAPITLSVLNSNGVLVGPADRCDSQADGFTLREQAGIAIGGNRITGLGSNGREAFAADQNAIAFGNAATTEAGAARAIAFGNGSRVGANANDAIALGNASQVGANAIGGVALGNASLVDANATGAVALGTGARASAANGVALGANSVAARGPTGPYTAIGLAIPQSAAGEVSVGAPGSERQITNVAAGLAATDAVNVGQLAGVRAEIGTLATGAVQYDTAARDRVTLAGPTGTTLANVAPGTLAAGSTEAVNGGQLFTTNANVSTLTTNIGNGAIGTVQYSNAATPTVPNGGVPSNDLALVGAAATPVGLHNVANGVVAAGSTDAVNGGQLAGVSGQVGGLAALAVQYDDATRARVTLGGVGTGAAPVAIGNVAAGTLGATSTDAVNGSQLFATNTNVSTLTTNIANGAIGALQYSSVGAPTTPNGGVPSNDATLVGGAAGTVALHNVGDGIVAAGSTDAVNGSQLFATNANVTNNGAAITNLSTSITNGGIGALQYSNATTPTTPNGGVPTNDVALVGAAAGPVGLHNVADGTVAVGSTDAVNGGQLATVSGQVGGLAALAVQYDDATRARITLGGVGTGTAPVAIGNVAAGTLGATSTDAVNGSQLFATNTNVSTLTTNIANGAIGALQYSSAGAPTTPNGGVPSNDATLVGGAAGTVALHNVGDGVVAAGSTDAVNGGQLATVSTQLGGLSALAVQYDDLSRSRVTFGGAGAPPVVLGNVAAGTLGANSTEAVNGSQLFATNANVTNTNTALTNLSTSISNGGIGALQYSNAATPTTPNGGVPSNDVTLVGGTSGAVALHNVGNGLVATGSTDAVNGGQLATVSGQLGTLSALSVQYDDSTRTRVSFGGVGAAPVVLGNVAAGTLAAGSTEAVNGGQLVGLGNSVAAGFGGLSRYDPASNSVLASIGFGGVQYGTVQSVFDAVDGAINGGAGIRYFRVLSTRADGTVTGTDSLAIGPEATVTANNSVALGTGSSATRGATLGYAAVGLNGLQNSVGEVSVGAAGGARQITNVAAGTAATDAANVGQVAGVAAQVAALGSSTVQYDNPAKSSITLGGAGGTKIINVAAGTVAAGSTDAVNGAQLAATNTQVANNTTAITNLGNQVANGSTGPVQYSNPGSTTTPNGGTRTNDLTLVGAAAGPVGLHNVAAGAITAGSTDAVTGAQVYGLALTAVNAVSYGTDANGARTNTVTLAGGNAAAPVTVTNVAAGNLAANSTDAVNGGQLNATNQAVAIVRDTATAALSLGSNSVQYGAGHTNVTFNAGGTATTLSNVAAGVSPTDAVNVGQLSAGITSAMTEARAYTDGRIAALNFDLQSVRKDSYAGTSGALAAAGLPQAYEPGKGMIALGGGAYGSQSAIAIGVSKAFNDGHTVMKLGGTYDSQGKAGASGGIGYQF